MSEILTLRELNLMVRDVISISMPGSYWVAAELAEVRESAGHCYMSLVEKDDNSNTPVARASAKCWRNAWLPIRHNFERMTQERLRPGMKVLLLVHADFHEAYGFSWIVTDIDPTFTLGDMALRRQETIRRLKEEGVFDLNKQLEMPLFAQNIAVITSSTAAGYGDFCSQLAANQYNFKFKTTLFQAVMQGEAAESSIIEALNRVNDEADLFDCVVITRGGGAVSDLSCFDSLVLAENIANFPLPVITGIGHERDESVADMVAHTRVKTPTAAAVLLTDHLKLVSDRIDTARDAIIYNVKSRMDAERMRLSHLSTAIPLQFSLVKSRQQQRLDTLSGRMRLTLTRRLADAHRRLDMLSAAIMPSAMSLLTAERHRMEMLSQRAQALDPSLLLSRGYSITTLNGRAVTSSAQLKDGDVIETRFLRGKARSVVAKPKTISLPQDNDKKKK